MQALKDSAREVLDGRHYATLATHNDDGTIHTTPVWYLFENGNLYVGSPSFSRKARNIAARPSASMLVDIRKPGSERWVSASGPVAILTGDESLEINSRILHRYLTEAAMADPRVGPAFAGANDITICLRPETWRSWSSTDLDRQFFGGLLGSAPEKWFRPVDD
ncbi:MAG TPA: pyridoxamine 5'-phosphate oxidase family protein [Blastocatellia bacterium]|nr:pyridoxamine 5'-phosphate oxidase family protein [Blastocatellia bacterium]